MDHSRFLEGIDFKKPPSTVFLKRLTNQTGMIQHAKFAVPDRNMGYSVDDNARGLLACVYYNQLFPASSTTEGDILDLAVVYLSFVDHAKTQDNWFYNFLTFDNKFLGHAKTEDGFGRVLWALGYTVFKAPRRDLTLGAKNFLLEIKDNIKKLDYSRAQAYSLLGCAYLSQTDSGNKEWKEDIKFLADKLVALFDKNASKEWCWFEDFLSYANAMLPYSLAFAYQVTFNDRYLEVAKASLDFLEKASTDKNGVPAPVGQNGWYFKGKEKAQYDQQPLEAADMVLANIELYKITFDHKYLENAQKWFAWYHGNNSAGVEIYDAETKGCFDGLTSEGVNLNQGAESIVTYLLAYLAFSDIILNQD